MAFTPRSFDTILSDMISYVKSRTDISDFNPGSVVRTILEAAALEDDEQYFQMVQLLDLYSYTTASGSDLDRRLQDFGLFRQPAKAAQGTVRFFDTTISTEQIAADQTSGATTINVFDTSVFPTSGFPYTIRIAEGTTRVQDVSVTANNTAASELTLDGSTPLDTDVFVGDRVSLVTGASSRTINAGTNVQSPATISETSKLFSTKETATIVAGNFYSNEVLVESQDKGINTNVGSRRITQFSGSTPFSGAGVINDVALTGGRNRERDADFRSRALETLQSLSRGTVLALKSGAIGVTDPATGQRVVSANVLEDFDADEVVVYIDDGTGLEPDSVAYASSTLASSLSPGNTSISLNDGSAFPGSGYILIGESELVEYQSHPSTNTLTTVSSGVTSNHNSGDEVFLVDTVSLAAETAQRRFNTLFRPIARGSERVFKKEPSSSWVELTRDTDYVLNRGTGHFILTDVGGVSSGTQMVAFYTYYTNLIAETQKVLEGAIDDSTEYPGIKAAGIRLSTEAPIIKRVPVRLSITVEDTFVKDDLVDTVRQSVESYILSRKIGQDVFISKIIDAVHDVRGIKDVKVTSPTNNIVVLESELPVPFDSNDDTLIVVS